MDLLTRYDLRVREEMRTLSEHWGLLLTLGIVVAIVGIIALGATVFATLATVMFLGAVLLIAGLVEIVTAFTSRRWGGFGLALVSGILEAIVGFMLLVRPGVGAGVLTLLLALMFFAGGIARIVFATTDRFPSWGWSVLSGIVGVVLGVLVFVEFPTSALWFLGLIVAVELLFRGVSWIALAFGLHRVSFEEEPPRTHAAPPPQPAA